MQTECLFYHVYSDGINSNNAPLLKDCDSALTWNQPLPGTAEEVHLNLQNTPEGWVGT